MRKIPGVVIYDGPSRIDGKPIIVVATFKTANTKTGDMIQTWILRRDVSPIVAINNGSDISVCGSCPLRGIIQDNTNRMRGCYVKVSNAPRAVWQSYQNGNYPKYNAKNHLALFDGRKLRLGAYGDPVASPLNVWKPLMRVSSGWSGYTHQWRDRRFSRWSKYIMASTHTIDENKEAQERGFRWFRSGDVIGDGEMLCPASEEAGKRLTCATCLACSGGASSKVSVFIPGHGAPSVISSFRKVLKEELSYENV